MTHIFLYGPPGTGKSTVGKILARNLKLPFIDLDRVIETKVGVSIPQIMQQRGEPAFRELESAALRSILDEKESVIALGGGALLNVENHEFAQEAGKVVLLMAELDTLFERLNESPKDRPLLVGDLRTQLSSMLARRSDHYNSFALRVQADGKSADENALEIGILLGRFHLSAMGEYDVMAGRLEQIGDLLLARGLQTPIIVTDENVAKFHFERVANALRKSCYEPKVISIPAGEEYKNLETVSGLWKSFLENGLDRKSTVIALGGGVIGDMTGFAASTYMRGINWVGVPTTLLSMVDASLGGKTGFDLPEGKNLIGAFHPPKLVLADTQLLTTLPETEFISGLAEVVKHGIISDPELFSLCSRGLAWIKSNMEEIVRRAMAVKIKIIEEDPYERGIRAALNLGHTVGHAVELVSGFELRHGEAVAIGMVVEAKYAERIGLSTKGLSKEIGDVLCDLGLPIDVPNELPRAEIILAMRRDKKKNVNAIRFALPVEIGKVELMDVMDLEEVLE